MSEQITQPASAPALPARRRLLLRALFALKLTVSFGLLALLFYWIDVGVLIEEFANLRWSWLVVGLAILQTQYLLSTWKWSMILNLDGHRVPFRFLWRTYLISGFLSLFMPSSFGGDVYRVWALNQRNVKVAKSTASVLFDRVTGMFALVTIGMAGALFLLDRGYVIAIFAVYVIGVAAFLVVSSDTVIARLPTRMPRSIGFIVHILRSVNVYRSSPRRLLGMLGVSFVFQFNIVLVVVCYARALRIPPVDVSFLEFVAMVPVVYLTEMLPITINGLGVREGTFVFFFKQLGGTAEQALGLSLLVVAIRYVSGLLGGGLLLQSVLKRRRTAGTVIVSSEESTTEAAVPASTK